jgi:predicted metal-dependent HD superfamily phosphohydrolase
MSAFEERWITHWAILGLAAGSTLLERVLASYAEPARHYHTLQHLGECLDLFQHVAHLAARPGEVALALWFHDAVYVPLAKDNEARSADWAIEALRTAGASETVIERIAALIMATAHHEAPAGSDARLVIDIDLAILGSLPARFTEYEQQIRSEYAAVPADLYAEKRREVLAGFLARPAIYATPELHARLEEQARTNLSRNFLIFDQADLQEKEHEQGCHFSREPGVDVNPE